MYQDHFSTFAFELSDFQKHAIESIVDGHHILVCAPTGSGKTLPAEFAIRFFTSLGKKVIYTSPIKALSNQKYYEFSRKFPELQIGLCTGDIKTNPSADVIIMTAEILNNRLFHINGSNESSSSSLDFQMDLDTELAAVIMDEVHYINDEARGHVWEQTILTLPPQVQMIMLSATLDGPENFAGWIETTRRSVPVDTRCIETTRSEATVVSHRIETTRSEATVVSHHIESTRTESSQKQVRLAYTNHRIVPLTHYAFVPSTESFLKTLKDKALQQTVRQSTNTLIQLQTAKGAFSDPGYKQLKHVLNVYEDRDVRLSRKHALNSLATFLKGSDDMDVDDSMLPAIVFVFSRKQVEKCAEEITANILPFDSKIPYTIAKECEQLVRRLPNYKEYLELPEYQSLVKLLEKGVAIHHSGMIPILREIVELMISKKYVYLLFATESFAIGLDCPIRTAVFSGLSKFDGSHDRFLLAHEYTQMAGRAGRRGIDTVGHVVHLPTLFRNGIPSKDTYQQILSGKPQTLVSKFHVDYGMVLRLLKKGVTKEFDKFADRSMVYDELLKKTAAQQNYVSSLETALQVPYLRASAEQCEEYLRLETALKTAVNKKRKQTEHAMQQLLQENRHIKEDAALVAQYKKKQRELEQEKSYATGLNTYLETQTQIVCKIMQDYGYIACDAESGDYSLTHLGEIASQIAETHPLVMAKCVQEWNLFAEFSVQQIVGFLACFVDVKVPEEYRAEYPKSKDAFLKFRVAEAQSMFLRLEQEELNCRADTGYKAHIQFDMIDAFMEWTKCEDEHACKSFLQRLASSEKAVSAGDFAKAGMKICALAKELDQAFALVEGRVEAQHKLSQIDGLVLKYITTTQSLYL
jgi:superfamily II RNA helicase